MKNETLIKDALLDMSANSGASLEYATGIVAAYMALGMTFTQALKKIADFMPHEKGTRLTVPDAWRLALITYLKMRGINCSGTEIL